MAYPSDVTADEWRFVAPYLCLMSQHALQRDYALRGVFNALASKALIAVDTLGQVLRVVITPANEQERAQVGEWFYGFKVQVITTSNGVLVECYMHAGSEADITGLLVLFVFVHTRDQAAHYSEPWVS